MTIDRMAFSAAALALGFVVAAPAMADPGRGRPKRVGTHPAPRTPAGQYTVSDFIKGSPAQQELERRDNDLARLRPVDHRKDDFFSDWRGLR